MSKKEVNLGDTFIAYINDSKCCVGVVVKKVNDDQVKTLILGLFTSVYGTPNVDVFGRQEMSPFPTYKRIEVDTLLPYLFEQEIKLCRERDDKWWKQQDAGCFTNLLARHFQPRQIAALTYIDATKHILSGGVIDGFSPLMFMGDEDLLKLWSVLRHYFPKSVQKPPSEWDAPNSNVYYTINEAVNGKPNVIFGARRIS